MAALCMIQAMLLGFFAVILGGTIISKFVVILNIFIFFLKKA